MYGSVRFAINLFRVLPIESMEGNHVYQQQNRYCKSGEARGIYRDSRSPASDYALPDLLTLGAGSSRCPVRMGPISEKGTLRFPFVASIIFDPVFVTSLSPSYRGSLDYIAVARLEAGVPPTFCAIDLA